jgi:hypothetical protein
MGGKPANTASVFREVWRDAVPPRIHLSLWATHGGKAAVRGPQKETLCGSA